MSDISKLFIVSKGKNLDEQELWKRIVKTSNERFEETVEIVSEGRQNTPISENYTHYIQAKFVAFVPARNRSFYINTLVNFQTNTLPNIDTDLMCSISGEKSAFAEGVLFLIALDLINDYDLYLTDGMNDHMIQPMDVELIKRHLTRLNISF